MSRVRKTTLRSGVNVITEEMPDAESSTIGVWVHTGSRNEDERTNGISHLIEHMLFKGTATRTAHDISREIETVGGVLNAFTSREYTCFYAKVLNKDLPRAADLLSDIYLNSTFSKKELDRERKVVLQEIRMVEDTPDDLIHDIFAETFWKGHPLGASILGTAGNVESITRADILDYYARHYRSERVFITVAGGVRSDRVLRLLKPTFGRMEIGDHKVESTLPEPFHGSRCIDRDLEQVHICLGVPVPKQADKNRYKLYLLNTILGSGMSSRLFQEIREKRGLVYSIYSYLNLYSDSGSLVVYAGTSKEHFPRVAGLILKQFASLRKGVSAAELREAKSHLKGAMLLGLETSENRMTKLARDEIYFKEIVPIKRIVASIDRVTTTDIRRTAERLLTPDKTALTAIGRVRGAALPASLRNPRAGARRAAGGAKGGGRGGR